MESYITDRISELVAQANKALNIACPVPTVHYMRRGSDRATAYAWRKNNEYSIRINRLLKNDDDTLKEILPHEVAHIVIFWLCADDDEVIDNGRHHGESWQYVARLLGCSGERIAKTSPSFNINTHRYLASNNEITYVSKKAHKLMQEKNRIFSLTNTLPRVTISSSGFIDIIPH